MEIEMRSLSTKSRTRSAAQTAMNRFVYIRLFSAFFAIGFFLLIHHHWNQNWDQLKVDFPWPENQTLVSRRVLIFGIDGVGTLPIRARPPNLAKIFDTGRFTGSAQAVYPTSSYECWTSLFRSVRPAVHGVTTNGKHIASPATYSVFKLVSDHQLTAISIVNWRPINVASIENGLEGVLKLSADTDEQLFERFRHAVFLMDPSLIFIQYDPCDAAGHRSGYFSEKQTKCLKVADSLMGKMISRLEMMSGDTFVMAMTDHGGGGAHPNQHGSDKPADMTIFWGLSGPGISGGALKERISLIDMAPIVAHLLKLPIPPDWDGRLPASLQGFEP
jgi:predicted AlkP superfamily pyrophosphatase or phosphodiesterase